MMTPVVITGAGFSSPLAANAGGVIRLLQSLPAQSDEMDDGAQAPLSRRQARGSNMARMATIAAKEALSDSHLPALPYLPERVGTFFETALCSLSSAETHLTELQVKGPRGVRPTTFLNAVPNGALGCVAMDLQLRGVSSCLSFGALPYAAMMVAEGQADAAVVTGADERCRQADEYLARVAPDVTSGEAACSVVLESAVHARRRGRAPYAQLKAWAWSRSANATMPFDGTILMESASRALAVARISPEHIGAVIAADNGAAGLAEAEADSLGGLFDHKPFIMKPKKPFGEIFGASTALAAMTGALVLSGRLPLPLPAGASVLVNSLDPATGSALSLILSPVEDCP